MRVVDSQVHLWEAHRADRPWPPEEVERPIFVAVPGARPHRAEPMGSDEMVALMDAAGVDRAVIVPPSPVGDQNLTALEAVQRHPGRFGIMGRFDPTLPRVEERIAHWREQPGMLGIRMTFHKPRWAGWLAPGALEEFWSACEVHRLPLMLLAAGHMADIDRIASEHPELTLILDHMGRRSDLRDAPCFDDLDLMLALARHPKVCVKASAAPCYTNEPYPFRNLDRPLERIFDAFGPQRMFWGSDLTRLPCSYLESVEHFRTALLFLDNRSRPLVMGEALSACLRWP